MFLREVFLRKCFIFLSNIKCYFNVVFFYDENVIIFSINITFEADMVLINEL